MAPDAPESPQEAVSADVEVPKVPEVDLPVPDLRTALMQLRRPFSPQAVHWKVQSNFGEKGCLVVGYIDARLVIERLNLVVADLWFDRYTPLDANFVECALTVGGVTRLDVGEGRGKAGRSDALKRAAVKFGVGVSLYAIPRAELWRNDEKQGRYISFRKYKNRKGDEVLEYRITPEGDRALRDRYGKWLEARGIRDFGVPLDHGDVEGAVGDVDVPDSVEPDAPEGDGELLQLLEGSVAEEKRKQATAIYEELVGMVGRSTYPPAQFQAGLASHGHSLEALDAFIGELSEQVDAASAEGAAA
jgi:hypothetical protein